MLAVCSWFLGELKCGWGYYTEICPVEIGCGHSRCFEEEVFYQACPGVRGREKETNVSAPEVRL